jgi:hypothetical protein
VSEIKIHESNTHSTTHRAVLNSETIKEILAVHVAELAGVASHAENVQINVHLSSRMGNYGTIDEAIVTITVDHRKAPRVAES